MKLTTENYHGKEASQLYMGTSQFKSFLECPAKAMAEIDGTYERGTVVAFTQGLYFDSFFEGNKELFESQNHILKKDGKPLEAYEKVIRAYNRVTEDEVMFHFCNNGKQQVIMTGEIQGVSVKIAVDSLHDDIIIDRKCMQDFKDIYKDGEYQSFAIAYGYDIQDFIYTTIVEQNIDKKLPFVLACVTKEKVPNIELFQFSEDIKANAEGIVRAYIQEFAQIKNKEIPAERCGKCNYCISTKKLSSEKGTWRII